MRSRAVLAEHAKLRGIVKEWRTQDGERQERTHIIWGNP
jgi:hypothetical protein